MRWPLRNQILVPFTVVMLAVIVAVTFINAYLAVNHSADRIQNQLQAIGATMQKSQFPLTEPVLEQMRGLSGAEFVATDSKGSVVAQTLGSKGPQTWDAMQPVTITRRGESVTLADTPYVHLRVHRAHPQSDNVDLVHVLYPVAAWDSLQRRAALPPLIVGSVAVFVVVAISVGLAHRISKPLRQVTEQVTRIARNEPRLLTLPHTDDEVRQLVSSVNFLVSELSTMQDAVKRSERLAMLGKLSGGLAHHLRNCVTGASLSLQLHQRRCHDVDQDSLAVAQRQLELTEEHLKGFLAVGQPQPLNLVPTELKTWAVEIAGLIQPACAHRGVRWRQTISPQTAVIAIDAAQLRQAVFNLVVNATEAVGTGGTVELQIEPEGETNLAIRVYDDGPGLSPDIESKLFEPFATSKPEGVGLGLAVARQIANAHGGSISYRRRDGKSCFEILLPIRDRTEFASGEAPGVYEHTLPTRPVESRL